MRNQYHPYLFLFFFSVFVTYGFTQQGTVSGILKSDVDGLPLPGVSIVIKGTNKGVQTDFDGNYKIDCKIGDILVFSSVGMKSTEVKVTTRLFGMDPNIKTTAQEPVAKIQTEAYANALKELNKTSFEVPSFEHSERTFNKNNHFEYNRIKAMEIKPDRVELTYFDPDIYYEIGYSSFTSFQFIKKKNLPELQTSFSQGAVSNNKLSFLGPETGNPFSYGPYLRTLEFDGSSYPYDVNGRLVTLGNGNGIPAQAYDNSILKTNLKSHHNLFFKISTEDWILGFDYNYDMDEDAFGREASTKNNLALTYKNTHFYHKKLKWDTSIRYTDQFNAQPNTNGFINNLFMNLWTTPTSFENSQGATLNNQTQRSYSPLRFNNPEWLFNYNKNADHYQLFLGSIQNQFKISDDLQLTSKINYQHTNNEQNFGLVAQTVGFENGYLSQKNIEKNTLIANVNLNYKFEENNYSLTINSAIDYGYDHLKYRFNEATGFNDFSFSNPNNKNSNVHDASMHSLRVLNEASLEWHHLGLELTLSNSSFISSLQKNHYVLPTGYLKLNLIELFEIYSLDKLYLSSRNSFDVKEMPLFYNNQSHNSLVMSPSETLRYTANQDLFLNDELQLEKKIYHDVAATIGLRVWDVTVDFGMTYFYSKHKGSIFPVHEGNGFQLRNTADIQNNGIEMNLELVRYRYNNFGFNSQILFSTYRSKVLDLKIPQEHLAIAGFSTVSKNLVVGQPAGVIYGSAYARDAHGNQIIGAHGFPLVASELQQIGNPTPDFNLSFSNGLTWKRFQLNFVIDFQKGGDVWNGTQNVLNYYGTSQQSAQERGIKDYVFAGVNAQGHPNTIPVDFYNPSQGIEANRFVRYGFEGVAEDAIEDGSYINLKSVDITYSFANQNNHSFFRAFDLGLYANNLFTYTKYRGASPYSSLYDTHSGQGLNFFNTPIATEIGLKLNIKI